MNLTTLTEIVVFEIGGQMYGLHSAVVRELVRAVSLVSLPKAPPIIEGIINMRGTIVPVLDIRDRFRLAAKPPAHTDHLILAYAGTRLIALRVDRVLDLASIANKDIDDAEKFISGAEYVAGVAKLRDGLVLLHDLETFLLQSEAAALDELLPPAETKKSHE